MPKIGEFGFINESTGGGGGNTFAPFYGSFYDTTTQTCPSGGVVAMKLNSADLTCTSGFTIANDTLGNPTRITATYTGVYDLEFSAQLYRVSGGTRKTATIWIRVSEVNVPNTATIVTLQANADYLVASWNWLVNLNAGQYVEIMWSQNDDIQIEYVSEDLITPHPAVPSVIATICKIN
jgi:hypothetical protein